MTYVEAVAYLEANGFDEPDPADFGVWVPGVPALIEKGLDAVNCAEWLKGLILDGIVAGLGAVLGFVPQMLVLFIFLAFLTFNLLCAPCFAAIGAIKREMNSAKWTWFAIGYQCLFAYAIALMINQFGSAFTGDLNVIGLIVAVLVLVFMLWMLFKPYKESAKLTKTVRIKK